MSECWVCEMGWPTVLTNASAGLTQPFCEYHMTHGPKSELVPCRWCSSEAHKIYHYGACPRVKRMEFYEDGTIKRVEFHDAAPALVS